MGRRIWNFESYKKNVAITDENGFCLSYDDIIRQTSILYEKIGYRCLVFILCRNSIGSAIGYIGMINNNVVPLLLNAEVGIDVVNSLMDRYHPSYVWIPNELTNSYLIGDTKVIFNLFGYSLLKTSYLDMYPMNDELALLLTTSGSTGSPKFVRQSYRNIEANTTAIIDYLELDENERPITTLPMNYTYGLSVITTHLKVGANILFTNKGLMQKDFWRFFKEKSATSIAGVPYTYEMLNRLRIYRMDLPSLKTMTQAGGKLSPELHEKFAKFANETGRKFIVMYGQCEATARMGFLPPEKAIEKKGSMGIPIPGGSFILVDADGVEISENGVTGELVYKGENVTLGYAECGDDLIKGDERNGILYTGDMSQRDDEGFYYIVGRKKRFLKMFGNRVNLDEIEQLIKGKFGVPCAASGIDDHMYIFITNSEINESVIEYISSRTKLNRTAFKIIILKEIPINDAGKTQYSKLERYYNT